MNQCCLHTHNLGKEPHLNCIFRHIITSSLSHICFISLVESMGEKNIQFDRDQVVALLHKQGDFQTENLTNLCIVWIV